MGPQSKIHRPAVSAGVGRAQSEQGLTLSPTRLFRSVRAQARLETLRKNAQEHWSARNSALWWTRPVSEYRSCSG
ncbi:hypothetical protein NDU88_007177 [Pleurodeles waltl]|uniref:Uncharacterized protein n=1 Tax=Pleurodeles waltl TaxID=8319 RepID=A0AAV7VP03_PLEWA|nr:hypothetical protein NDU88_007177 [Pleurodeles waltl]